jgi:hypothetical protein
MDDCKQNYIELLNKKLSSLTKMLETTQRVTITGEGEHEDLEKDAEQFASLYERREVFINTLKQLDESLAQFKEYEKDPDLIKAATPILKCIGEKAKSIAELDKKNIAVSAKISAFFKGNLKKLRDSRDISNKYSYDIDGSAGHFFDSAK